MKRKAIKWFAALSLLLILLSGFSAAYTSLAFQPPAGQAGQSEWMYKNTPTPRPTVQPTALPPEYRTQSHNPGLLIGAVILLGIIVFGVLRYSRPESP